VLLFSSATLPLCAYSSQYFHSAAVLSTSIRAQEQAAAAGVKTIKPDHVLEALPELDWGEADTARLRKDLKKQLKGSNIL